MTTTPPYSGDDDDELQGLFAAFRDETISEDQFRRLEQRLSEDAEARIRFARLVQLHVLIEHKHAFLRSRNVARHPSVADVTAPGGVAASVPPSVGALTNLIRMPAGYLSGWPLAYLITTAVFAVGTLIAAFTYVTHPVRDLGEQPGVARSIRKDDIRDRNDIDAVGRVTGMAGCQWEDSSKLELFQPVAVGQKVHLASGLIEISYGRGAKVILQGPVRFAVDSTSGGFLSFGRLTATVDKNRVASGRWPVASEQTTPSAIHHSPSSNPSLSTTHHPLFTITTPDAVVTDLGTEFGVEVDKEGRSHVRVFQGKVELARNGPAGETTSTEKIYLTAGQSAGLDRLGKIIRNAAAAPDAEKYVRALPHYDEWIGRMVGLQRWYRADAAAYKDEDARTSAGQGDPIACWIDQSHNQKAVQTREEARPVLAETPNGRPVVRFDGVDDVLQFDELQLPRGFTVIAVAGNHQDNKFFVLLGQYNGDVIAPDWDTSSRLIFDSAGNRAAAIRSEAFRDDRFRLFTAIKSAGTGQYVAMWHTNGLRETLGDNHLTEANGLEFNMLGARPCDDAAPMLGGQFGKQDIAELLVFDRDLPYVERRRIEGYLTRKYGITIDMDR